MISRRDAFANPVAFAEGLGLLDLDDVLRHLAADEVAAYERAEAALLTAEPALRFAPHAHPWHGLHDAAWGLAWALWAAGLRAGAASEHLRSALVGPRRLCARCHGGGVLWGGQPYATAAGDPAPCPGCGGSGAVPTPAPTPADEGAPR